MHVESGDPDAQSMAEACDSRTDVWALGVLLYEATTGRRPFAATATTALVEEIVHQAPAPPRQWRPDVSERLEDLLLKWLEKDVGSRYQSAREVATDLRRLQAPATGSRSTVVVRRPKRRRWVAAGAVLVGALGVAGVIFFFNAGGLRDAVLTRPPTSSAGQLRVAELPFKNVAGEDDLSYLADGATFALTNGLVKVQGLGGVIASAPTRQVADLEDDLGAGTTGRMPCWRRPARAGNLEEARRFRDECRRSIPAGQVPAID